MTGATQGLGSARNAPRLWRRSCCSPARSTRFGGRRRAGDAAVVILEKRELATGRAGLADSDEAVGIGRAWDSGGLHIIRTRRAVYGCGASRSCSRFDRAGRLHIGAGSETSVRSPSKTSQLLDHPAVRFGRVQACCTARGGLIAGVASLTRLHIHAEQCDRRTAPVEPDLLVTARRWPLPPSTFGARRLRSGRSRTLPRLLCSHVCWHNDPVLPPAIIGASGAGPVMIGLPSPACCRSRCSVRISGDRASTGVA